MKTQSPDTHPNAEKILIERYRQMSPWEKLRCVQKMNRFTWNLTLADVRERYPDADERERRLRAAARWLEADLMRKAFGWDTREKGY